MRKTKEEKNLLAKLASGVLDGADSNGMITLKGYHRIISNIIQTSFLDPNI